MAKQTDILKRFENHEDEELFTFKQLPEILDMKPPAIRYHIYVAKDLVPDHNYDGRLVFKVKTIKAFLKQKRPAHRPLKALAEKKK